MQGTSSLRHLHLDHVFQQIADRTFAQLQFLDFRLGVGLTLAERDAEVAERGAARFHRKQVGTYAQSKADNRRLSANVSDE